MKNSPLSSLSSQAKNCAFVLGASTWSPADVKAELAAAADTIMRLPFPKNGAPSSRTCMQLDVVRAVAEAYGYTPEKPRRAAPSPEAITRMDETVTWLAWLDRDRRRVVWMRACGVKWRRIEDAMDRTERTLRSWEDQGLSVIAQKLADCPPRLARRAAQS